jgi:monomeric sarcosine oxidase
MVDAIVLGVGGVGAAALYALAKRGLNVLGIDQHQPPHSFGSSHGDTRIIRKSYFEHPSYVPLLQQAYSLWKSLEQHSNQHLYHATGLLEVGPSEGAVIQGVLRSAKEHQLPIERMSMGEAERRFPGIRGNPQWEVILENDAGYLLVERCIQTQMDLARSLGATVLTNTCVTDWSADHHCVRVQTPTDTFIAKKLILCAGPWSARVLQEYKVPLKVLHKHLYWYQPQPHHYLQSSGFPCFFYDTPDGYYYGFPQRDSHGLKVARHSGGIPASQIDGLHPSDPDDQCLVESFLHAYMPHAAPTPNSNSLVQSKGCYYTMTPDEHFIVGTLPDHHLVYLIAGLSGHGFKFTSVLGELAAQFVADETPNVNLDFLKLSRFSLPNQR